MSLDWTVQWLIPRNGSTNGPIFKSPLRIKSILKNYNPSTHPQYNTAYNRNIQSAVCLAMNCANLIYGTTVFVEAVWLKQRVIKGPTRKNLSTILLSEIYWLPCCLHTTEEDRDCMPGTKVFLYLCIHSHWAIHCMPTGIFQQCFFVTVALQCVNYCPASHPLQIHFGKICCTHSTILFDWQTIW